MKATSVDGTHESRPRVGRWLWRLVRLFFCPLWKWNALGPKLGWKHMGGAKWKCPEGEIWYELKLPTDAQMASLRNDIEAYQRSLPNTSVRYDAERH